MPRNKRRLLFDLTKKNYLSVVEHVTWKFVNHLSSKNCIQNHWLKFELLKCCSPKNTTDKIERFTSGLKAKQFVVLTLRPQNSA